MKTEIIKVNNVDIECSYRDNEPLITIKSVCEAIGVDYSAQLQKLKRDEVLNSTMVMITTVGGDGKQRQMGALPLKFVFGWIFSIEVGRVKAEVRQSLLRYKWECYDALYEHFYVKHSAYETKEKKILEKRNLIARKESEMNATREEVKKLREDLDVLITTPAESLIQIDMFEVTQKPAVAHA